MSVEKDCRPSSFARRIAALAMITLWGLSGLDSVLSAEHGYRVLSIEDGDTLLVEMDGRAQRLQLLGIDAPEDVANPKLHRDQQRTGLDAGTLLALGQAATRHLGSLVPRGQTLMLEGDLGKRDKYGRVPVIASNPDGRVLNEAMVQDGYAVVLGRNLADGRFRDRLRRHEETAVAQGRGLWGTHQAAALAWSGRAVED